MVQVAIAKPNRRIIEHVENTKANHKWFISLALSLTSCTYSMVKLLSRTSHFSDLKQT